ncbi:MAG: transcription antitermination factor NusB [Rhizobiaceae bacterium]|nr:transcription antitermination factor NusB [Rhizobiaceae bacterium]
MPDKSPKRANKRGAARLSAVQALYQMELTGAGVTEIVAEYENLRLGKEIDGEKYLDADKSWFRTTLIGVIELQKTIDPIIHEALPDGWPLKRLEVLLRAILRAGVFELVKRKDVPSVVVITEYVDIAKAFFDGDEWRMVNGLLDKVARKINSDDPSLKALENSETKTDLSDIIDPTTISEPENP